MAGMDSSDFDLDRSERAAGDSRAGDASSGTADCAAFPAPDYRDFEALSGSARRRNVNGIRWKLHGHDSARRKVSGHASPSSISPSSASPSSASPSSVASLPDLDRETGGIRSFGGASLTNGGAPAASAPAASASAAMAPAASNDTGLARTIETEIIPRLMLAHQGARRSGDCGREITRQEFGLFCDLVGSGDIAEAKRFMQAFQASGMAAERLLIGLLSPAAKHFGELWESDQSDFATVTLALLNLQRLLRDVSASADEIGLGAMANRRVLLAPAPQEQHFFGVLILDECFRRADWDVVTLPAAEEADLIELVSRDSFDVVGLSVSCDALVPQLEALIAHLRSVTLNREMIVLVGGRCFSADPALGEAVGADAIAEDAVEAVHLAETLTDQLTPRLVAARHQGFDAQA